MSGGDAHCGSITAILVLAVTTLLSRFRTPVTSIEPPLFAATPTNVVLGVP